MLFSLAFTALVVVAAVVWVVRVRRTIAERDAEEDSAFRVAFVDGKVASVHGRIPRALYNAFEDVAAVSGVTGEIRVSTDGDLAFSAAIPDPVRQQFRNVFWAGRH